jgi:hypothetical protein
VAAKHDIFFVNFGRWHFNNCAGLQLDTYRRSLRQLAAFYEVKNFTTLALFRHDTG